jgi:hypothetical protein
MYLGVISFICFLFLKSTAHPQSVKSTTDNPPTFHHRAKGAGRLGVGSYSFRSRLFNPLPDCETGPNYYSVNVPHRVSTGRRFGICWDDNLFVTVEQIFVDGLVHFGQRTIKQKLLCVESSFLVANPTYISGVGEASGSATGISNDAATLP